MNTELFRLINNLAYKNVLLDKTMIFFSKDVPYIFVLITAVLFIFGIIKNDSRCRRAVVSTFVFTLISLLLNFIIGNIYYINRPFVNSKVNLLFSHVKDASFPSDHAAGTMSIAFGILRYDKILSAVLTILSFIVGFSRVYVGHHYPSDVIGAYIIVFVTGCIYNLLLRRKVEHLYITVEKNIIAMLKGKKLYKQA